MSDKFNLVWTKRARETIDELTNAAKKAQESRAATKKKGKSRQEATFKQVMKCVEFLASNPRHPGLQTHQFTSVEHPYELGKKVFEAYAQNRTPGAYRVFWCYGPSKENITIIAITPHP